MKNTSILSTKPNSTTCVDINMLSSKTINHLKITNLRSFDPTKEKAIIINMFTDEATNKKSNVQFTYTLKQEDGKRLNKNGILRVYDLNEAIDIPVEKLLGKWKNTHVGVTLISNDEKWSLKNDNDNFVITHEPLLQTAIQKFLKFVVA